MAQPLRLADELWHVDVTLVSLYPLGMQNALTQLLSANVRAELARRGQGQRELAHALGLSRAAVSNRLNGKTPWTVDELEIVAQGLGVEPASLLTHP